MAVSLVNLALAIWVGTRFDPAATGLQFAESAPWIPSLGIGYSLGVDGLALPLVLLTAFLAPLVALSTYTGRLERAREQVVCLLLLQTCVLGGFLATDLVLFYVFWEATLVPVYFLIGIWGGQRRVAAALKFFLYTMAGSLLMLVAVVYTAWAVKDGGPGGLTFEWAELAQRLHKVSLGEPEKWLFLAFALAFAIKVPLVPFHTWLPDAYVEAPTGTTVFMSSVLVKLGAFGFLRYALWLFPRAAAPFMPGIAAVATFGVIYGALLALAQSNLKRMVAYASMSHLGLVMLGMLAMTTTSLSGSVVQMVNHGISTAALFLLVGVIHDRRQSNDMADCGGLASVMPLCCAAFLLMTLSAIGLPGLNGFVGEFLIMVGTFQNSTQLFPALAVIAAVSVILAPGYLLWAVQRTFFGPLTRMENARLQDLQPRELILIAPLALAVVVMGVYPQPLLDQINPSVARYTQAFRQHADLPAMPTASQMEAGPAGGGLTQWLSVKPAGQAAIRNAIAPRQ